MNISIFFLFSMAAIFSFGCSTAQTQEASSTEQTSEIVEPQPISMASPIEIDSVQLDQRFPKPQREILRNAELIELFETKVCAPGKGEQLTPVELNKFQNCDVLRYAQISDPHERKELITAIHYSIGTAHWGNACFSPRHGVRAKYGNQRIELLICFECENFRGASNSGSFGGGFSPASKTLFERLLSKTGQRQRK